MLQFNSVNAVFLLTSREVNRFALHSNIVSAVFLLTSREVNLLKQQFNLVNAVFSLTSSAVSWLSVHHKILNDVKYSMPFRLVIPLLEQLIFLTAAISVSLKLLSWLVSNFLTTVRKFASGKLVLSIATPALWTAMPFSPSPLICARAASDCVSGISLSCFSWSSFPSGWDASPSAAGSTYFPQFSAKAPSTPQTGHSVFIVSSVQAVSQVHTGDSSASPSANAVFGTRKSIIHTVSRILINRFFMLSPPFLRPSTA